MFLKRPNKDENEGDLLKMQLDFLREKKDGLEDNIIASLEKVSPKQQHAKHGTKIKKQSLYALKHNNPDKMKIFNESAHQSDVLDESLSTEIPYVDSGIQTCNARADDFTGKGLENNDSDLFEQLIAKHSVEEILEMKRWYLDRMGPEMTSFLRNRNKSESKASNFNSNILKKKSQSSMEEENRKVLQESICKESTKEHSDKTDGILESFSCPTRFGLCGEIVKDKDSRLESELYHHDEEPERGGYTLQELFLLTQSSYNGQRCIGLKMLSCIVKQAKLGLYHGRISKNVFPVLIESDAGFLARLALDSSDNNVIISAIEFLHALLVNSEDETAIDYTFSWHRGHEQPIMNAVDQSFINESQKNEDVINKDLVEGLLRMNLIARISYFINKNLEVDKLLDIIIRICRHYKSSFMNNYKCFLDDIVKNFLPLEKDCQSSKLMPHHKVIKIIRILGTSDVIIAKDLLRKYGENVFQYFCVGASPIAYVESLRFFVVLLRYGLSFDKFQENIGFITTRLVAISESQDLMHSEQGSHEICLLLCLVETGISLWHENKLKNSNEVNHEWSNLLSVCIAICKECMNEFVSKYFIHKYTISTLLTSLVNCASECLEKFHDRMSAEAINFAINVIEPCFKSMSFERAISCLRENSCIIPGSVKFESLGESSSSFKTLESIWADSSCTPNSYEESTSISKKLMPSLIEVHHIASVFPQRPSSLSHPNNPSKPSPLSPVHIKWHPIVNPLSTAPFLVAMAKVVMVISGKNFSATAIKKFLSHPEICLYLSKFVSGHNFSTLRRNWFSRFETHFVYYLVKLANRFLSSLGHRSDLDTVLYHNVSLKLLTCLHQGDEVMAAELIKDVVFNEQYFRDFFISINEIFDEKLVTRENKSPLKEFGADILTNLSNMGDAYIQLFSNEGCVTSSRSLLDSSCHSTKCLMVGNCNETILSNDWLLQPFYHLYSVYNQSRQDIELYKILKPLTDFCKHSIRALFLFEKTRSHILENVSLVLKLTRLMEVVITAGIEFEEDVTYSYLDQIMKIYGKYKKNTNSQQAFSSELYDSFLDMYMQWFGGIPVYEVMIFLPFILSGDSSHLWDILWTSRFEATHHIALPICQLPFDVALLLKHKNEDNLLLIRRFILALRNNIYTHIRTPIPYLIAIHSLNCFLFCSGEVRKTKQAMESENWRRNIARSIVGWSEPLKTHVLLYKCFNVKCRLGFELYESLPTLRLKHLNKLIEA